MSKLGIVKQSQLTIESYRINPMNVMVENHVFVVIFLTNCMTTGGFIGLFLHNMRTSLVTGKAHISVCEPGKFLCPSESSLGGVDNTFPVERVFQDARAPGRLSSWLGAIQAGRSPGRCGYRQGKPAYPARRAGRWRSFLARRL